MYRLTCVTASMSVFERERVCITCPVGVGVRYAPHAKNANAINALLCCDGQKKCISIVTLNGSALGDCCHGDKLLRCLRHRIR